MEADLQGSLIFFTKRRLTLNNGSKALQLLEFLIKNGSERVIDDARSHLSLLKMLRQFHYIDQNGKDQGVNVRNRSKELAELLSDVERIRAERKKARANRNKFGGVEGGAMTGGMAGGSRYGGFGSDDAGYGGYSGGVYGDGGGFGGQDPTYQDTSARRDRFEEYDEHDEGGPSTQVRRRPEPALRQIKSVEPPKSKEPVADFLSFDDDVPPKTPPKDFNDSLKAAPPSSADSLGALSRPTADDDDFDDFQSATPMSSNASKGAVSPPSGFGSTASGLNASGNFVNLPSPAAPHTAATSIPAPSPAPIGKRSTASTGPNYNIDMSAPAPLQQKSSLTAQAPPQPQQPKGTGYQASTPNYFTSVTTPQGPQSSTQSTVSTPGPTRPSITSSNSFANNKLGAPKSTTNGSDAFGSLWSSASSSAGIKKTANAGNQGPNLASLQREKASQGIWGHSTAPGPSTSQPSMSSQGSFVAPKSTGSGGALDDLLG